MSSVLGNIVEEEPTEEELSFMNLSQEDTPAPVKEKKKNVEPTQDELDFFEMESPYQQKPQQEDVGYWRSIMNSVPRGLTEGLIRFGRMMGPLQDTPDEQFDEEAVATQLDKWFPTDDELVSNTIKKTGQILPIALSFPVSGGSAAPTTLSTATRAVAGSAAGEGLKMAGAPEWLQTLGEIVPWIAPNVSKWNAEGLSAGAILTKLEEKTPGWLKSLVRNKGPESIKKPLQELVDSAASKKEILDFARSAGMTEAEITPLLQGESKQRWLSKLSSKGESMDKKISATRKAVGKVYDSIAELPGAQKVYTEAQKSSLIKAIQDKFSKMPASVRNVMKEDFQQLIEGDMTGNKVMKFFKDLNHELGPKTKQLSTVKDPIGKSLMQVDLEMGHMYLMTNKLASKYYQFAKRIKPGIGEGLWSEAKSQGALWGVMTGDVGILKKIAKVSGAKKVAEWMLTSPRMQNLSGKMVSALNSGKAVVAQHIQQQMIDMIKDVDPRVAAALEALDIEAVLSSQKEEEES